MKSLKIAKILGIEVGYIIRTFYRRNSHLKNLSYSEHFKFLKNFAPVHFNHFSENMQDLGYECEEFIFDLESLQKKWAQESGCTYAQHSWKVDILMQQLCKSKPDVIFLQNLSCLPFWIAKGSKILSHQLKR